ncbi:MAG TPA: hypothetical protein IAB01_01800 [Candidatus Avidesulfovibrio excrementigallinarum]|nr:hypothetical protein [Candidatus Avidesulfovibrio excrementigallinarum]
MPNTHQNGPEEKPLPWSAYVALIVTILFFSGMFSGVHGILGCLDFTALSGSFGKIAGEFTFVGQGGTGARYGFLFALSLVPGIMLALAVVEVAERLQALRAAQRLLTPLLKPLLGLPGAAGLALISSLQSSDAGAAMTRALHEKGLISESEKLIFVAFQFSSASSITVYLSMGVVLFPFLSVSHLIPLGVILFYKVVGTNLMRLYLHILQRGNRI